MRKYFYEIKWADRSLNMRQYIYHIGPYRYNWHEELEIMLVLKGQVELSCGGVGYSLKEDDLILIDSNVGHASLAKNEGGVAMVIHLNPAYLRQYYSPIESYRFFGRTDETTRDSQAAREIRRQMAVLITRMDTENPMEKLRFEQELNRLLYVLLGLFPPRRIDRLEEGKTRKQKDMMERIVGHVEEHYQERITLDDEYVNGKLEEYQRIYDESADTEGGPSGRQLLCQDMADGLAAQADGLFREARNLAAQMEEVREKLKVLKGMI